MNEGGSKPPSRLRRFGESRRLCVSRIYTDVAVLDFTPAGPAVRELLDGLSLEKLERCTTLEARS